MSTQGTHRLVRNSSWVQRCFQVTVTPPFGSGFDPVTDSFTYNADCVPVTVTLTYDAQGGVGEPGDQSGDAGSDVTSVVDGSGARWVHVYWLEHRS